MLGGEGAEPLQLSSLPLDYLQSLELSSLNSHKDNLKQIIDQLSRKKIRAARDLRDKQEELAKIGDELRVES